MLRLPMKPATLAMISSLCATAWMGIALGGCDAPPGATADEPAGSAAADARSLNELLSDPDIYGRARALALRIPQLGPEATPEIEAAIQRGLATMSIADFELLMRAWASRDPRAASLWAIGLGAPRFRNSAVDIAVEAWAQIDPSAALEGVVFALHSPDRELSQSAQRAIVRGWFRKDRGELETYIRGLGDGVAQQRSLLAYSLALWEAEGGAAVIRWAEALPSDPARFKQAAFRQVSTALAWADPEAARRWCETHCDGPFGKSLRTAIVRTWIHEGENAAEVLEWVARAPDGPSRVHALRVGYETWAMQDRRGALDWMKAKIEEGPAPWVRLLFGAYARQLSVTAPAEAIVWAEQIEAPQAREEMLVRIARRWLREDRAAAEAWLNRSSLSESARAKARNLDAPDYLPEGPPALAGS